MSFLIRHSKLLLLLGILLLCLSFACSSFSSRKNRPQNKIKNDEKIANGIALIQDGDLILRTGRSFISAALRRFSKEDNTYSHCGIIRIENGKHWVYHVIGGEENPTETLRRESIKSFCNPKNNVGFGIFRYQMNPTEKEKLDSLIHLFYLKEIPFDRQFDLENDQAFYCSEFIYKVVSQATDSSYLPVTHLGDFKYIAIDNLYLNKHTQIVYQSKFY